MKKGSLETLKTGDSLLLSVRKVKGGKYSLELAEVVRKPSVVSMLNEDDDRFVQPKPRRAWTTGTAAPIEKYLGIKVDDLKEEGDIKELNILNPELMGERMRVLITETTEQTEFQSENLEKTAKQVTIGNEKFYFTHDNKPVFSNTKVVLSNNEVIHQYLSDQKRVTEDEFLALMIQSEEADAVIAATKIAD